MPYTYTLTAITPILVGKTREIIMNEVIVPVFPIPSITRKRVEKSINSV